MVNACEVCTKSVYPLEAIVVQEKTYHKICFKCMYLLSFLYLFLGAGLIELQARMQSVVLLWPWRLPSLMLPLEKCTVPSTTPRRRLLLLPPALNLRELRVCSSFMEYSYLFSYSFMHRCSQGRSCEPAEERRRNGEPHSHCRLHASPKRQEYVLLYPQTHSLHP